MPTVPAAERQSLKQISQDLNVHLATVWRWTLHGVRGRRLPSFLVGGRRYVRKRDLEAFLSSGTVNHADPAEAKRRSDIAANTLAAHGVRRR